MPDTGSTHKIKVDGFMQVPNQIWAAGLKPLTMVVYLAYLKHADNATGESRPSHSLIGALCRISRLETVREHTDILLDKKLIEVVRTEAGKPTTYRVLVRTTTDDSWVRLTRGKGGATNATQAGTPSDGVPHEDVPTYPARSNRPTPLDGVRTRPSGLDPENSTLDESPRQTATAGEATPGCTPSVTRADAEPAWSSYVGTAGDFAQRWRSRIGADLSRQDFEGELASRKERDGVALQAAIRERDRNQLSKIRWLSPERLAGAIALADGKAMPLSEVLRIAQECHPHRTGPNVRDREAVFVANVRKWVPSDRPVSRNWEEP